MSLNVGTLTRKHSDDNGTYFEGFIVLEQCQGRVCLVPNQKHNPKSPDFKLKRRLPDGRWLEYGGGWLGKMKGDSGEEYVSLTIMAPGMASPIYIKAFPADDQPEASEGDTKTVFNVIWSPPRPSAGFAPAGGGAKAFDDAIPF